MALEEYGENDIILVGGGGHAKVIIDVIRKYHTEYRIAGILDNDSAKVGGILLGFSVIGTDDIMTSIHEKGVNKAFISLGSFGDSSTRQRLYEMLRNRGFSLINVIHRQSAISEYAQWGDGNAILAGVIINVDASIGNNCIINSGSIIEHDCKLGSHIHIAPGAKISGGCKVGDGSLIGVGASVIQSIEIGANCIIGAGSVVTRDIPANSVAVGIPAKVIKMRDIDDKNHST